MPKKKDKQKQKTELLKKNIKLNIKNKKIEINYKNITNDNFIIKEIGKDENYFYRTISYFYRDTEEYFNEFREIIQPIQKKILTIIEFIPEDDINIPEDKRSDTGYIE